MEGDMIETHEEDEMSNSFHSSDGSIESEDGFTDHEKELVFLLLHIDTTCMPDLEDEREAFIQKYFRLKEGLSRDDPTPFDDDARTAATAKFKKDLEALIVEGRSEEASYPPPSASLKRTILDPEIRKLLIDFCEVHAEAIMVATMNSSRTNVGRVFLKHTPNEYLYDDDQQSPHRSGCQPLYMTFDSLRATFELNTDEAADYIMDYIRFEFDDDLKRFINDLMFVVVLSYLRLHEGHLLSCGPECKHREEMGARMRALHFYGCLEGQVSRQGVSLAENLYEHVEVHSPRRTLPFTRQVRS